MSDSKHSRRALLQRLGAGLAFLPLLTSERKARAAETPRRFIVMQTTNGVIHKDFWPQSMDEKLTKLNSTTSPLDPFIDDLVMVGGVTLQNMKDQNKEANSDMQGHVSFPYLLTGAKARLIPGPDGGPSPTGDALSVDQHIAEAIMKKTPTLARKSMHFGAIEIDTSPSDRALSFRGPSVNGKPQENLPAFDPYKNYKDLMSLGVGGTTNPSQAGALDKLRAERKSVLDFVRPDCDGLTRFLSREDKLQVQQHCEQIRAIEKQLDAVATMPGMPTGGACSMKEVPAGIPVTGDKAWLNVDKILPVQIDLMSAAIRCDITRVATISMVNAGNFMLSMPFLGAEFNVDGEEYKGHILDHHDMSHGAADGLADALHVRRKNTADQWFIKLYAQMVKSLKEATDVDGKSMLDNSLVVYVNHFSYGANHSVDGLPWILAGKAGGGIKTGRIVRLGSWTNYYQHRDYVPHNGLLCAFASAMGAPVASFGDSKYGGENLRIRG